MSNDQGIPAEGGGQVADGGAVEAAPPAWYDVFQDQEVKAWVKSKGLPSPEVTAKSYLHLERLMGADKAGRTLTLPDANTPEEEILKLMPRLGQPESPDGYELPGFEGVEAAEQAKLRKLLHDANLTRGQAKKLVPALQALAAEEMKQAQAAEEKRIAGLDAERDVLRKGWGTREAEMVQTFNRGVSALNLDNDTLLGLETALGVTKAADFVLKVGGLVAEANLPGATASGPAGIPTSAEAAKAEISIRQRDKEFQRRLREGEVRANKEWNQLFVNAYG